MIGDLAVKDVDAALVRRVLEPIWSKKAETAGRLDKLLPSAMNKKTREHHAALPYDELPCVHARSSPARRQRDARSRLPDLQCGADWRGHRLRAGERDRPQEAVWTVPPRRMNVGKEQRVPLSPQAVKVAEGQPEGKYLFSGGKEDAPLRSMAMLELLKRMSHGDLTVHGFRAMFRDWAAECTFYPGDVCEMALARAITGKVEAAYRRGDLFEKRPQLMLDWAKYCDNPKGEVVPVARKRAATA
jgi:integrase